MEIQSPYLLTSAKNSFRSLKKHSRSVQNGNKAGRRNTIYQKIPNQLNLELSWKNLKNFSQNCQ